MAGRIMNTHTYTFEWTYADARCAAEALDHVGLVSMACDVEAQMPEPWKVGDWFEFSPSKLACRIIDISGGVILYHYRTKGSPVAGSFQVGDHGSRMDRCEPPDWWEGDR